MKRICALFCAFLFLVGCAPQAPVQNDTFTITATTYPIYLFVREVTLGMENVRVERLNTGSVSCLHDYTLSVSDMKKIERADVIAISGAGLEDFMSDALASTDAHIIDCSEGIQLLPASGHHDHDHNEDEHEHFDPHYWMDPLRARTMVDNLGLGLSQVLPEQADLLTSNAERTRLWLQGGCEVAAFLLEDAPAPISGLITFHDGFGYFADILDLPLLRSIEEEAGSEASAKEIVDITRLVKELHIPLIFTEVNGSDATANAIARETGCRVAQLSTIMDGPEPAEGDHPVDLYRDLFLNNVIVLINGFAGQEVLTAP